MYVQATWCIDICYIRIPLYHSEEMCMRKPPGASIFAIYAYPYITLKKCVCASHLVHQYLLYTHTPISLGRNVYVHTIWCINTCYIRIPLYHSEEMCTCTPSGASILVIYAYPYITRKKCVRAHHLVHQNLLYTHTPISLW